MFNRRSFIKGMCSHTAGMLLVGPQIVAQANNTPSENTHQIHHIEGEYRTMHTSEIQIRDPFVLPVHAESQYYLFGTTDKNAWHGPATGFDCYRSMDLENWEGPIAAFRPPAGFWSTTNYWAPEVHYYQGKYYLFATFKEVNQYRGTQILVADRPEGPYLPMTEKPVTPKDWECLDGTLYVDESGTPWMVFCHEWVQIHNGAICAMPLTRDLKAAAGRPVFLFNASEAAWVLRPDWPGADGPMRFPTYVTDGPFLYKTQNGTLLMLWSSIGPEGYAMGYACSESNQITGPWVQEDQPLYAKDGGHGMLFKTFDGQLMVTFHTPNTTPNERAVFFKVQDTGDGIRVLP